MPQCCPCSAWTNLDSGHGCLAFALQVLLSCRCRGDLLPQFPALLVKLNSLTAQLRDLQGHIIS